MNKSVNDVLYNPKIGARYEFFVRLLLYPNGIRAFVLRNIDIRSGERILDAGCGYGVVSRPLAEKIARDNLAGIEHHAFDISPYMLEQFRSSCNFPVQLQQLDVRKLPYPDGSFDVIATAAMLEYVEKIEEGLTSLERVLKSGGRMYIFMSRKTALNDFLFKPFGNPTCYSPQDLTAILKKLGFSSVQQMSFPATFFWLNLWGYVLKAVK